MDTWLYYDITHRLHTFCNPVSEETVAELEPRLELSASSRVLDVACGLGEMLIRFAEHHGCSGVGVDLSPYFLHRAEARKAARVPDADLRFIELDGKDYRPDPDETFDVVMCIGASWIWDGCEGTLRALMQMVRPGGLIVSGEPHFWRSPPAEYLEAEGLQREQFASLDGNLELAERLGLSLVWMRVSSETDWDRYEMLQVASVDRFVREEPDHPDLPALLEKFTPQRHTYLRWGREHLGFAFWVFRAPVA
jgi:SAM-dependent methyltransferase